MDTLGVKGFARYDSNIGMRNLDSGQLWCVCFGDKIARALAVEHGKIVLEI